MKPESLHKVAETMRSVHHHHLGVTAYPPKPPNAAAAARLERPDIQAFTIALDRARAQWPHTDLCLIGAHGAIGSTNIDDPTDTLPPAFSNSWIPKRCCAFPLATLKTRAIK